LETEYIGLAVAPAGYVPCNLEPLRDCSNDPINYYDPTGHYMTTTWTKSNKTTIKNYWKKAMSDWAKVKECSQIVVTKTRSVSATVSSSFGLSAKAVSVNVGLSATVSYSWSAAIYLTVNQNSTKKWVRAVFKADAYRWDVKRVKRYYNNRTGLLIRTVTTKGKLYRYKEGSGSVELEYSNTKHA
jgi:hypothetical protein